ncbi:dihydrolipoyl dehydrogenase [Ruania zhangjianzhongii]|uniref:dihydrolipoyl dehydrogenase n=1 Tax=Ruania zhangjianzhongii TaxID=2603206 RepID=UPI001F42F046|nr:dihydrolipoyl dehydrogenase [Ruania zhangjianzhongii]
MSEAQEAAYDVVVLGAGSGGYACALRASQLGLRVALIDEAELGGTCLHRGCIPTKALLHAAEVADEARSASQVGVRATFDGVDGPGLLAYQQSVVDRLHKGLQGLISAATVDWVPGRGRLVAPDTVAVQGTNGSSRLVRGRHVVIATGSQVRTLDGVAFGERIISSDQALRLEQVPQRALVLGGGVIGVEFASIWASFGAEVTIVEAVDRLLPGEDPAISKGLQRALKRRGITARTGARVANAEEHDGGVRLALEDGTVLEGDVLLVAVGRGPVTADLGLDSAGVQLDGGFVRTDERLRTSAEGIYAVGDVVRGLQLAHRGFGHGIFVAEEIAGRSPQPVPEENIPRVTYCDPQVASVGLTEPAARERFGDEIDTVEQSLAGNGKSQILHTTGMVKMVRHRGGPILGVHLLGARMGEQIGEAQMLVNWEAYPQDVAPLIHAHPTQNESLGEAALALAGSPLHSHN